MEEEPSSSLVFDANVRTIKFSIATANEIRSYSINDSPICHPSQLSNPFLGLPLETGKCDSCGAADIEKCEGHFGFVELPIPLYHPSHVAELINVLNMVCLKCMRLKKGKEYKRRHHEVERRVASSDMHEEARQVVAVGLVSVSSKISLFRQRQME